MKKTHLKTLNITASPFWKTFRKASRNRVSGVCNLVASEISANNLEYCSLNIVLGDDKLLQSLNSDYRQKDKPTNVLSFPYIEYNSEAKYKDELIGEIFISHETLLREAQEQSKKLEDHFTHLLIHSVLHVFGYDHIDEKEAEIMEALEVRILQEFGINNPYILQDKPLRNT